MAKPPLLRLVTSLLLALPAGISFGQAAPPPTPLPMPTSAPKSPLDFTVDDIDGNPVKLSDYKGRVVLIVNVASKCGLTPQYAELQKLYAANKDKGLVILGFPANNFREQEPGSNAEIKAFCSTKYAVEFPLFAKLSVMGPDMHPLYQYLTRLTTAPQPKGDITWNFEKFLVGRDGRVVARYSPRTKPTDEVLVKAIEAEIAKAAP